MVVLDKTRLTGWLPIINISILEVFFIGFKPAYGYTNDMTNTPQKTKVQLQREAQLKLLKQQRAALRPKITKAEALKRRAASLRRLKFFDIISVTVLTIVLIIITFLVFEAAKPDAPNEAVINTMLLFWGAITLQSALMLRASFVRLSRDDRISEDDKDHPFKGWRLTPFTPVIATVILIPAILAGVYDGDDINTIGSLLLMFSMNFAALLLGALVAAFIIAPLEAIARGLIALARGDKTKNGYLYFGIFAAAITAFIVVGTMAVNPDSPYPIGMFEVALALLGIPGGYSVDSEGLLWLARVLILGILAVLFIPARRKKNKS